MRDHAMGVFVGAMAIGATPSFVRPVSGKLVSWFCEYRFRKVLKLCLPFVKERLDNTARAKSDATFCWTPPVRYPYAPRIVNQGFQELT